MKWAFLLVIVAVIGYFVYDNYTVYMTAVGKSDENGCKDIYIQQFKDQCYSKIGYYRDNSTTCEKIQDADERHKCAGSIDGNATLCEMVVGVATREECYSNVVSKTGDLDLCLKMTESKTQTSCQLRAKARGQLGR